MRCLLFAVVAGLAFVAIGTQAQDVVAVEEDHDLELDHDQLSQLLGDLFSETDFEIAREARARKDEEESAVAEEKAAVDPKDQLRYNSFIDTFLRRLNSQARSKFDPLTFGLSNKSAKSNKPKNGKKSNKKPKKSAKKDNNKGTKKGGKKGGKEGKRKSKSGRHPKDLDLEEVAVEREDVEQAEVEEVEVHEVVKREVIQIVEIEDEEEEEEADLEEDDDDNEEDSLVRVVRDAAEEESEDDTVETSRRGEAAGGKKKGAKKGKGKGKGKGKSGKKNKKGNGKKGNKKSGKGKKSSKDNGKKSKRSADKGTRTSKATVTGVATLVRDGDVTVRNSKNGKNLMARFKMGAVSLSLNRKYGSGAKSVIREAKAVAPELTGKLVIDVKSNGVAKLSKMVINKPSIVQTEGSLRKSTKGKKEKNNRMENSINKVTPLAAKKLKIAAREILSAFSAQEKTIIDA